MYTFIHTKQLVGIQAQCNPLSQLPISLYISYKAWLLAHIKIHIRQHKSVLPKPEAMLHRRGQRYTTWGKIVFNHRNDTLNNGRRILYIYGQLI